MFETFAALILAHALADFAVQTKGESMIAGVDAWHKKAEGKTCIDCHKGIAHALPAIEQNIGAPKAGAAEMPKSDGAPKADAPVRAVDGPAGQEAGDPCAVQRGGTSLRTGQTSPASRRTRLRGASSSRHQPGAASACRAERASRSARGQSATSRRRKCQARGKIGRAHV